MNFISIYIADDLFIVFIIRIFLHTYLIHETLYLCVIFNNYMLTLFLYE
jgi:hypothetical protein